MLKTLIIAVAVAFTSASNAAEPSQVQVPDASVMETVKPIVADAVTAVRGKTCESGNGLANTAVIAEVKSASFAALSKIAPTDVSEQLSRNKMGEDAKAFIFKNTAKLLKMACTE